MSRLSPERALLMEIALELLGNTVYDIHGKRTNGLRDLFKDNTFPFTPIEPNGPNASISPAPELHNMTPPQQLQQQEEEYRTSQEYMQPPEEDSNEYIETQDELQQIKEKEDREFVEFMMKKIDIEHSNIIKESNQKRQTYFLDFWERVVNSNENPDISEEDCEIIANKFFHMERKDLESQCKQYKETIIGMKRSASTQQEINKIKKIAERIALVKDAMEECNNKALNDS